MQYLQFAAEAIELAREAIAQARAIGATIEDPALRTKVTKAASELKADPGSF